MALKFETTWNDLRDRVVADDANRVDHNLRFGDLSVDPGLLTEGRTLRASLGDRDLQLALTDRSYSQYLGKLGIPFGFATKFSSQLQADMIAERLPNVKSSDEVFLRTRTDGTARALLSGRYGDMRDRQVAEILDEILGDGELAGFRVLRGTPADHGFRVTLVGEGAIGRFNGDEFYPTIQLGNSEVGAGSFLVVRGVCKGACSNGMLFGHKKHGEFRIRHLGSKMAENVRFAMHHALEGMDKLRERTVPAIAAAAEIKFDAREEKETKRVVSDLRNRGLTKRFATESIGLAQDMPADVYGDEFPASPIVSRWGLVNAMTHLAHEGYDQFQRYDIEAAAGALLMASLN